MIIYFARKWLNRTMGEKYTNTTRCAGRPSGSISLIFPDQPPLKSKGFCSDLNINRLLDF